MSNKWELKPLIETIGEDALFTDGDWIESKDQDSNGEIRLVQLADILDGSFLQKSSRYMTLKKSEELRTTKLRKGDLLIARMPEPIGRSCIFPGANQECVTIVDIAIARPTECDNKWLMYYLNSPEVRGQIEERATGSTRKRISRSALADLEIKVPPLPEQKKIAEILLGLTRISETLKTKIQKSRNLFACLLDEQFSPANPARTSLLEDISEFITYGLTVRPKYIEKGFPMVSAGECKNGFIDFAKAKKISKSDFSQVRGKTIPSKGDLLITKTGTLGRVAVVPEGSPPFTITQNVALVRPKRAEVIPEYLAYYIMSPTCQREIRDKTSVLAIPDLQLGILGNFGIPIPSMDAQMDVHSRFDSIASAIAILGKKVDQIDCLKNSLANELLSGRKRVSI